MKKIFLFLAIGLLCIQNIDAQQVFNVRDYGAGGTKNQTVTSNIQKAIDECHHKGGGTVFFPAGDYLSGTIVLKSNVSLHLDQGATLFASQDVADYQVPFNVYKNNRSDQPVLIYAEGAENISIEGKGTIHGQARREYDELRAVDSFIAEETEKAREAGVEMKRYYKIPPFVSLVYLVSCKDVDITDISILESVDWSLHVQWSDRVNIRNIYIQTSLEAGVNADGIDIDGSRNVTVSDCIIETGDDAIVLKSTLTNNRSESCENIIVSNCVLSSTSTALKIGTETYGDFKNILFNNCVVKNSNRGFSIVVRDGGTVSDVMVSNITMDLRRKHFNYWGNADPIWLVILKRNEDSKIGKMENISMSNILAHGQGTSKIEGFEGHKIVNVFMNNVQLFMEAEDAPDKRATHALLARDVKDLSIEHLRVSWDENKIEENWESAFLAQDVDFLRINNFHGRQGLRGKSIPVIELQNVKNAILTNIEPSAKTEVLIKVSGENSKNLNFLNNDLGNLAKQKVLKKLK
jgi:hypothetical protein